MQSNLKPLKKINRALSILPDYFEGRQDVPLRDVAVLLLILDSADPVPPGLISTSLSMDQPKVATVAGRLKGYGLIGQGPGTASRVVYFPTEKGAKLKKALEHILEPFREGTAHETP